MTYNVRLLIEYDGTNFHGWQKQANLPTIQGELEDALTRITKQPVKITGAGRTDSGVHAAGQAANFSSALRLDESSWVKAINSLLPPDIVIKNAEYVPTEFNARYNAKSKIYQYIILNSDQTSPFLRNFVWHVKQPLSISSMKDAAGYLTGKHDFSSFRASECSAKSPVRTLDMLEITPQKGDRFIFPSWVSQDKNSSLPFFFFTFEARSYLQHMVRNIVGTLIEVGRGRFKPSDIQDILNKKDRCCAGPIAPSHGLFLMEIRY